jgi:hypothetical protein
VTFALAEVANDRIGVRLRAAPALSLHGSEFWRADGNSPVRAERGGVTVFFSDYQPRGHTFRRRSDHARTVEGGSVPVWLIDDPDPQVGKWIEAVWRDPAGALRGWYHAEELAPCVARLFVPHIGELVSHDDGASWRCCGEVLRTPAAEIDCSWRNGFFAGGCGDLSVVPDRDGTFLYLAFSSYLRDEAAQGVVMARLPASRPADPSNDLELWCADGWRPAADGAVARPLWPQTRGWRHADPDGFWGPALHYNQALDAHVMLLNRTANGASDLLQEGIYCSVNVALENPDGWSEPLQLVQGGGWYPQVVGLDDGQGDTIAGASARFFMSGFSAWEIELFDPVGATFPNRPLVPTPAAFAETFGAGKRCPW